MSLNFLQSSCREAVRQDKKFGLCDDENGTKAYSTTESAKSWIATVKNDRAVPVVFTPVDQCIIHDNEYEGRGRCDGILTSANHLYFIELKHQKSDWISDSIEQLESTIEFFKESHDISLFKHKKAFACNKRRGHFQEIDKELNLAFFRKHTVRIDVQAEVVVI